MRLPAQDLKQNEDRKRRRRTAPPVNSNLITGKAEEDADEVTMMRQEKVANFSHHKRVADYLLGRSVGEGSFAKVRLGLHVQTAEEVAIKVISKARARKDAYVHKNLRREGRILQMSRHKNVVQVYDILETDNNYYLVTEFCRGGELIDIVTDKGCLSENDVRRYVSQLVSAVSHLHDHGIVHRDLKVENLLLDDRGEIKIIDFGLSNVIAGTCPDPTRALATQCGSPAYAAPELLAKNMYGPKVDVWSIGVITYALLVGKLPFTVEPFRIPKLCRKMLLGDMNPIPSHLSGHCRHFIRRLLVPDPDIRPSISQVSKMPWISVSGKLSKIGSYGKSSSRPEETSSSIDINTEVVREMASKLDFEFSNVINCVRKNRPGEALATYYLLLKQKSQAVDSKDRRHNDVIGSDGNLDHENESDKSSDEEGLNDVDDVTNDEVFNRAFKKGELYKKGPSRRLEGENRNRRLDSPHYNNAVVNKLLEKHTTDAEVSEPHSSLEHHEKNCPKTPPTPKEKGRQRISTASSCSRKSTSRKSNGDIDKTLERLEKVQKRFESHFRSEEKSQVKQSSEDNKNTTEDSSNDTSPEKLPGLESSSSSGKAGRPERKSRGPTSIRELMKTMSRAKDALQRRSIFGEGKSNRSEEKKSTGSPELNKFRRLLSKNSCDSGVSSDRQPPSPNKPAESQNAQRNEEKLWRNFVQNGNSHPMRIKLAEATPPTTPLTFKDRAGSPTRNSMPTTCYHTNPRSPRSTTFYATRPLLRQRIPSMHNRATVESAGTPETARRHLPRISIDSHDFTNPIGYSNLVPRYNFPSPPRTPSSRETNASNATASGVRDIIEKFHALMNNGEQPNRNQLDQAHQSPSTTRRRDTTSAAMSYLSAQRRKREESASRKVPKTPVLERGQVLSHMLKDSNYTPSKTTRDFVSKQNGTTFTSHFGGETDLNREKLKTPSGSPKYQNSSRGIWYKSAV